MPRRTMHIESPVAGINRRLSYQREGPFSMHDGQNVRPLDPLEQRRRIGSRAGLLKAFPNQLGSGAKVNMLAVMRSLDAPETGVWLDPCDSFLSSDYDAPVSEFPDGQPLFDVGNAFIRNGTHRGQILKADPPVTNINFSETYQVQIKVAFMPNDQGNGDLHDIWIFARADDSSPNYSTGALTVRARSVKGMPAKIRFDLFENGTQIAGILRTHSDGTSYFQNGTITLVVSPLSATVIYDKPGVDYVELNAAIGAHSGTKRRIGFAAQCHASSSLNIQLDHFRVSYFVANADIPREAVLAASNGQLYAERTGGTISAISHAGITLNAEDTLLAVDRLNKLYIADFGTRTKQEDGVITTTNPDRLTSASIADWTTLGIEAAGDWLELMEVGAGGSSQSERDLAEGVYKITSVTSGYVVISPTPVFSSSNLTNITFRVVRAAKVYDKLANTLTRWEANKGDVPLNCNIIALFRDRMVLAGDDENPLAWLMSRAGDPNDFDYGAITGTSRKAVASTSADSETGQIAQPVTAVAAISEDYAVFSGATELWLLRGDPAVGGILNNVSREIGIANRLAWCTLPDGGICFLSTNDVMRYHPSQAGPEFVSRERMPTEFSGVGLDTQIRTLLAYDPEKNGVGLFLTPVVSGVSDHYWLNGPTMDIFRDRLDSSIHEPFSIVSDPARGRMLIGCRDGYIRYATYASIQDDGVSLISYALLGPFSMGEPSAESILYELRIVLDEQSGAATCSVHVGSTPELALNAPAFLTKTLAAGYNRILLRAKGGCAFIRIADSAGQRWAFDHGEMDLAPLGKLRV